jgi:hypothetical protein
MGARTARGASNALLRLSFLAWACRWGNDFAGLFALANPLSNPFVAFRTSPWEGQENFVDHPIHLLEDPTRSVPKLLHDDDPRCHISFSLGISKRVHGDWSAPIVAPPVVYPALPGAGPGRQVLLTQYEHLDMLSPSAPLSESSFATASARGRNGQPPPPLPPDGPAAPRLLASSSSGGGGGGVKEVLLQSVEFPLLLEGSNFWTSPVLVDSDGDGRPQAIVTDSAGGIYIVGLTTTSTPGTATTPAKRRQRSFQAAQVPRLFVRREWVEGRIKVEKKKEGGGAEEAGDANATTVNATHGGGAAAVDDPYHTYFEYYYSGQDHKDKLLQGVSANAWSQESADRQRLLERRRRQRQEAKDKRAASQQHSRHPHEGDANEQEGDGPKRMYDDDFVGDDLEYMLAKQRIMEEREGQVDDAPNENAVADGGHHNEHPKQENHEGSPVEQVPKEEQSERRRLTEEEEGGAAVENAEGDLLAKLRDPPDVDVDHGEQVEGEERGLFYDDLAADGGGRDRLMMNDIVDVDKQESTDDLIGGNDAVAHDDPKYGMHYDDYYKYRHGLGGGGGGDDTYSAHNERHREYYDTKHYIRIPPHVLCTPVLAELPKLYSNTDEKEDILFVAVSYFVSRPRTQRAILSVVVPRTLPLTSFVPSCCLALSAGRRRVRRIDRVQEVR